jgi:hypothetical protein
MPVAQTVDASDCKEEWIETIFSLLEGETLSNSSLLSVEGYIPDGATITLKKRSLEKLEQLDPIARSIAKCGSRVDELSNVGGTALEKGFYAYSFGTYKFSLFVVLVVWDRKLNHDMSMPPCDECKIVVSLSLFLIPQQMDEHCI